MPYDPNLPAELVLSQDATAAPRDWGSAEKFSTLREALEAAVDKTAEHPWIRTADGVISPAEVDDLWKEIFRVRSD